jgi:hypothetical protein
LQRIAFIAVEPVGAFHLYRSGIARRIAMPVYQFRLVNPTGAIVARQEFLATDDTAALAAADFVWRACAASSHFEVWEGTRRVIQPPPTIAFRPIDTLPFELRQSMLALGEALLRSGWRPSESDRLDFAMKPLREPSIATWNSHNQILPNVSESPEKRPRQ